MHLCLYAKHSCFCFNGCIRLTLGVLKNSCVTAISGTIVVSFWFTVSFPLSAISRLMITGTILAVSDDFDIFDDDDDDDDDDGPPNVDDIASWHSFYCCGCRKTIRNETLEVA